MKKQTKRQVKIRIDPELHEKIVRLVRSGRMKNAGVSCVSDFYSLAVKLLLRIVEAEEVP